MKKKIIAVSLVFVIIIGTLLLLEIPQSEEREISAENEENIENINVSNDSVDDGSDIDDNIRTGNYSNEIRPLPPIQTKTEIFGITDTFTLEDWRREICEEFNFKECNSTPWESAYDRQIEEYGDLASRFLFEDQIMWVRYADVDMDEKEEKIIGICGLFGNGCPHEILIVKGDNIIFSIEADESNVFTLGYNGFYIICNDNTATRFDYNKENGKFVPSATKDIVEWEAQMYEYRTYGRRVFKNLDESSEYKYFVVDPFDYTEDGGSKYSPFMNSLNGKEKVKLRTFASTYCPGKEADYVPCPDDYDGCCLQLQAISAEIVGYIEGME